MTEKPDEHLMIQLLQKGNVVAFDSLFDVYSPKLFGFAVKYFKNETDAEELVQEVFVKVWERRHTINSELSFKAYLFKIALNYIRKYFNKRAISLRYLESLQNNPEMTAIEPFMEDNFESVLQKITLIIEQMPPRRREIFVKSKLEGKSSKEIAAELKITTGTVDNHVSEGLRFIRTHISSENLPFLLFAVLYLY
jgi:RNA polymerase sigma-70 factor (ECF subfamily)